MNRQDILIKGQKRNVLNQEAWFVQGSEHSDVHVSLAWGNEEISWQGTGSWVLLLNNVKLRVLEGSVVLYPAWLSMLSTLLAFIDESRGIVTFSDKPPRWMPLPLSEQIKWQDRKCCEVWFLQQMLDPSILFLPFLAALRSSESYLLVRFLLAQSTYSNMTLQDLGERYGVSCSHFRRLCRHALGGGAKAKMGDWRMARSLLDAVEGKETLTQLAIKHGYASSSHFSYDVKRLVGFSPRELSNIIQRAIK